MICFLCLYKRPKINLFSNNLFYLYNPVRYYFRYEYESHFDSSGNFVLTALEHSTISKSKMNFTYESEKLKTWDNLNNTFNKFNRNFSYLNHLPVLLTHGAHSDTVSQLDHNRICYHLYNNPEFNQNIKRDCFGELVYNGLLNRELLNVLSNNGSSNNGASNSGKIISYFNN